MAGKGKDDNTDQEMQNYQNAPVQQTFQPMPPGGMEQLGSQLQAGYGSGGGDMMSFLQNLYQPMDIMKFFEPISTTASQFKEGNYNPIETGNPMLDSLLQKSGSKTNKSSPGLFEDLFK